jgi:uncharacterized protein (TIGR02246 family)
MMQTSRRHCRPRRRATGSSLGLVVLAFCAALLVGCGETRQAEVIDQGTASQAARTEIERTVKNWLESMNRGDIDAVLALVTDDFTLIPPGQPPLSGREAVAQALSHLFEHSAVNLTYSSDERRVDGGLAVERGRLVRALHPRDESSPVVESFNLMMAFQREGESWKLLWQVWNSNLPGEGA